MNVRRSNLSYSFENLGDPRGAVDYFRKCIELAKQMLARDAKNNTARRDLATSQSRAGQVLSAPEQRAESLDLLSQAVNGFEALLATAPTNGGLRFSAGNTLSLMAVRLRSAGDSVQALDCAKRAIQHLTTPAAAANPLAQDQLAASRAILGLLLAERGDRAGALEEAGKAAEIFRRRAGTVEANFTGNFAVYWSRVGDMYEALARQKDPSPDQRLADWRAAKDAYQRGAAEWRLAPTRQTEVAQLEAKIAECDAQIGRLLSQVPTLRPLPPAKID